MKNLNQLDLNLLKAFMVLMEERSVSRAAERLYLTQPAMSGILARLRDSFDDPLFVRVQRGIEPTNRAIELAQSIAPILHNLEQLLQVQQFVPQKAEMIVNIACTDYALRAIVLPFIQRLRHYAPLIKVATYNINEQQLQKKLIDFALVTPAYQAPDIHFRHLYQEEYVCAVGKSHPLAEKSHISLDEFCGYEQVLVSYSGGSFAGVTDQALKQLGRQRKVILSIQNFLVVPELLEQNQLLAVLPKRLVQNLKNIHHFAPPFNIEGFTKTLIWHERTHRDPAYIWLRQCIADSCKT